MKSLSSSLFLVCLSALIAEASASSSCTGTGRTAHPRGSYLHEIQLRKANGQKGQEVKVVTLEKGKVITYGTSRIENSCHYVAKGFDIRGQCGDILYEGSWGGLKKSYYFFLSVTPSR